MRPTHSSRALFLYLQYMLCSPAYSVTDDFFDLSPHELAHIHVTIATGTAKPVYQSASVTSVITAEEIEQMGATELAEVLNTIPGMHIKTQAITYDAVFSVRGIRNELNSQVLLLLNGTRINVPYKGSPTSKLNFPVEAIQQLEVIRGPGSAVYGADAFAGVINIKTKKADDIDGTVLGVRVGEWDTQSVWGQHSQQALGWDLAATVQYTHNNNDGDRIITSDAQTAFDDLYTTSASLSPGEMQTKAERWNAHINLQRSHWDINFWTFHSNDAGLGAGVSGALDNKGRVDSEVYLLDASFSSEDNIQDWEIFADTSYLLSDVFVNSYPFPSGTLLPIDGNGNVNPNLPFLLTPTFFADGVINQLEIENQVFSFDTGFFYKGFDDHLLRFSAGFRYEQLQTSEQRNIGPGITVGNLTDVSNTSLVFLPDSQRTIFSVSLQDEWQIAPDWLLTAGVRLDDYSDFGHTINPRVSLLWNMTEQLNLRLIYGQAFRAPSFTEQKQQNSAIFNGNPDLEPETIDTVELAFDYRPRPDLRLASNFFYYEIDDLIDNPAGMTSPVNASGQSGYGSELEWHWDISSHWNIKGNYAWQYSRNDLSNTRVINVPEHQVYLATAWQFLPQWQLQSQLNWVGHRFNFSPENDPLKDYATVDITLNGKRLLGYIDVKSSVRNVFDSHGKDPAVSAFKSNLPVASRSFYVQASIQF